MRGRNVREAIQIMRRNLLETGYEVTTTTWQGKKDHPKFLEVLMPDLKFPMPHSVEVAQELTEANQPWCDVHFEERVGGEPLNPPPSFELWNTGSRDYMTKEGEVFSHSYPERLWSKELHSGIRYDIADLNSAVELLKKEPETRQCYIPMFFPEDLSAAVLGERIPCTLGWHFLMRGGKLHCFYPMRSCDAVRHFHNDLYLAIRLCLWIIEKSGIQATPGELFFSATSFHCFVNDKYWLEKNA